MGCVTVLSAVAGQEYSDECYTISLTQEDSIQVLLC